jgi:hypothetical protein
VCPYAAVEMNPGLLLRVYNWFNSHPHSGRV